VSISFSITNPACVRNKQLSSSRNNAFSFSNATDANYTFRIEGENATGTKTNSSSDISMVVDTTSPLISYGSGSDADGGAANKTWIFVNITSSDTNNDSLIFSLYNSTALVNQTIYDYLTMSINFTSLPEEIYSYNVTANDSATNSNSSATRTFELDGTNPTITTFTLSDTSVEEGDTSSSVAEKFGISVNTVLWVNELSSSSSLKTGQELVILPVSGTLHLVRPYDTLSEIALWYKGDVDEIADYNGLDSAEDVFAGDFLIVPGGVMPRTLPSGRLTPIANSHFIYPIPAPHKVTQGLHAFNAIDFSNGVCGDPVYAAAGGTVQRAGYHSTGGNYVRVLHPNGVVTYYGHLSRSTVTPGEKVFQGEIIGYVGHSGYTIPSGPAGCHVHFEVRGAKNPF